MMVSHKSSKVDSGVRCWWNLGDGLSETKKSNGFRYSILIAIAHIIRFFIFAKKIKKRVFFTVFCNNKKQIKSKFKKSLICAIDIVIKNMWSKFHKDRFISFRDFINKASKNVVLRKTRLNFFLMKNSEKTYLHSISDACTI